MSYASQLEAIGIALTRKTGQVKAHCPWCEPQGKRNTNLSVNIPEGLYNCHRCGAKGSVAEVQKPEKQREYVKPMPHNSPLSEKTIVWFAARGLSVNTLQRFKISEASVWMPPSADGKERPATRNAVCFPYFRNGELVNAKWRDGAKTFRMEKGAELIFFGLELLEGSETAIIAEGEMDALSFYEADPNAPVVSVPNGAGKGNLQLEYLTNCIEAFADKKRIILATDNDTAGLSLRGELARRFGAERCLWVSYPAGCKDANEVLQKHGKGAVNDLWRSAQPFPLEGIHTVSDVVEDVMRLYVEGVKPGLKIGHPAFDALYSWRPGELTVWTGIPGHGKSSFLDYCLVNLAWQHDWKIAIFSPENQPTEFHVVKFLEILTGFPFYLEDKKMPESAMDAALAFLHQHFFFIHIQSEDLSLEYILGKAREIVMRKGINCLVIDPWNTVEHLIPNGQTETNYISQALSRLMAFAKANAVHTNVVAHPTKILKDKQTGKYEVPTPYSISGSAHWYNKPDNCLTVYKDTDENGQTETGVYVQKIRSKFTGTGNGECADFRFDRLTNRFKGINDANYRRFYNAAGIPCAHDAPEYAEPTQTRSAHFMQPIGEEPNF